MREYLPPHQLFEDCFNALHSEWRLWCNSEVHALRVVAAEGQSASVTLYFASPRTSVARAVCRVQWRPTRLVRTGRDKR
jgi:hypothetical protein